MRDTVYAVVREVASDIFGVPAEALCGDSSPKTVENWDSLQHLNLVLALEDRFETQFAPEEIERMLSLDAIADLITARHARVEEVRA